MDVDSQRILPALPQQQARQSRYFATYAETDKSVCFPFCAFSDKEKMASLKARPKARPLAFELSTSAAQLISKIIYC